MLVISPELSFAGTDFFNNVALQYYRDTVQSKTFAG
jgi:hypothetical protein